MSDKSSLDEELRELLFETVRWGFRFALIGCGIGVAIGLLIPFLGKNGMFVVVGIFGGAVGGLIGPVGGILAVWVKNSKSPAMLIPCMAVGVPIIAGCFWLLANMLRTLLFPIPN